MSRQEAVEQYTKALKQGRKCYKDCVLHGSYPYLQILDEILSNAATAGQVELGVIEIPTEQITGTKTRGRDRAFSADFMPLMDTDTEFATKWIALCQAHLGDEGIRDPIRCYEYLGRFYVQEGNKRVSVLKSYQAPSIPAYVIRVVPVWSQEPEILAYYEFMHSYQITGLYQVYFSRTGSFAKLQKALGYAPDHVWTAEERRVFSSEFAFFQQSFYSLGGASLPITAADALLVWLKVYPFTFLKSAPTSELTKTLRAVWTDIRGLAQNDPISIHTETQEQKEDGLFGRLFKVKPFGHLNVAFISEHFPQESDWARAHTIGREYLEAVLDERVTIQVFDGVHPGREADEAIETAIACGAEVIFATTPPLIGACRKAAALHPNVCILNCSVSMPYSGVRTYYSRIYEGKFIAGAIAGIMSRDGRIGYVASNPIFGVPASINAFALGAQLTNPHVQITLRWSCVEQDAMNLLVQDGISLISNRDLPTPDRIREPWGLCQTQNGAFRSLVSPYWHWGNVYVRLVRSILDGNWDTLDSRQGKAVNYWWGMHSRAIDILLGDDLPTGVKQLAGILRQGVVDGSILPFQRPIRDQSGALRNDGNQWLSPEEILHMDWLCDCVQGTIPTYEELLPMSQSIVRLQGVYRDKLPPEKEDPIL
ncbi:MAG: BMP family ABC transporter substrate-binding protein [Anaerotruncus sp.]|nr:BMP family ABC transporter substrate-binding protein [Anaerotruncus sp.]